MVGLDEGLGHFLHYLGTLLLGGTCVSLYIQRTVVLCHLGLPVQESSRLEDLPAEMLLATLCSHRHPKHHHAGGGLFA